jgi:hypothetical protein
MRPAHESSAFYLESTPTRAMPRETMSDLLSSSFLAVAQERSVTRAAAKLCVSQSALSHTIRAPETRPGVRLCRPGSGTP